MLSFPDKGCSGLPYGAQLNLLESGPSCEAEQAQNSLVLHHILL